jgi:RimJ/RimL family protein N-acetyltransferase
MLQDVPRSDHPTLQAVAREVAVIETERLTLRVPTLADVPAIARLANDRRISQMTRRLPFPYRETHAAAFIATLPQLTARGMAQIHLIEHLGEVAGMIGIEGDPAAPELGYWLGTAHWGRGFATEAARAAIGACFDAAAATHIVATARVANPASRNVLEKCGFAWHGCALHRFDVLGSSAPVDCFRLTREVWAAQAV